METSVIVIHPIVGETLPSMNDETVIAATLLRYVRMEVCNLRIC